MIYKKNDFEIYAARINAASETLKIEQTLRRLIELIHVNTHARADFALPFGFPSDRFADYIYKFAKYKGFLITIFF